MILLLIPCKEGWCWLHSKGSGRKICAGSTSLTSYSVSSAELHEAREGDCNAVKEFKATSFWLEGDTTMVIKYINAREDASSYYYPLFFDRGLPLSSISHILIDKATNGWLDRGFLLQEI